MYFECVHIKITYWTNFTFRIMTLNHKSWIECQKSHCRSGGEGRGISPYEHPRFPPTPTCLSLFLSSPSCLQSIKQHHKWAVQRTHRGPIHPLSPLETSLFHPPLLYIIRRLIRWLVIKLILRLVKLMHRYHRALIIHGTLSLARGALIRA